MSVHGASFRKRFLLVPLPLLAALTLTLWTALPSAAAVVLRQDVSGVLYNPCSSEGVSFQGTYDYVFAETSDGAGGLHLNIHSELHVTGTGDQGNTYVATEVGAFSLNVKAGESLSIPSTFTLISKGSAPNFLVKGNLHITINADGTVAAYFSDATSTCRG